MLTLDESWLGVGAVATGIARRNGAAACYAKQWIHSGKPLATQKGNQMMLADMAQKISAARLLCWQAGCLFDNHIHLNEPGAL